MSEQLASLITIAYVIITIGVVITMLVIIIKNIKKALKENVLDNAVLYKYGLYVCTLVGEIKNIDRVKIVKKYNSLPIFSIKDINIKADEICKILNKNKGPFIKEIYKDLEYKILNNSLKNNYCEIKDYLEHQI